MEAGAEDPEGWEKTTEGRKLNMGWQRARPGHINRSLTEELELGLEEREASLKHFQEWPVMARSVLHEVWKRGGTGDCRGLP